MKVPVQPIFDRYLVRSASNRDGDRIDSIFINLSQDVRWPRRAGRTDECRALCSRFERKFRRWLEGVAELRDLSKTMPVL